MQRKGVVTEMSTSNKKRGLGRGLESLFSDNAALAREPAELRLSEIEPNRSQPRREFDEQALQELSDSIARHGLLQPITVRPLPGGGYQIVAGERRWRAARMAGLETVPVVVRELSDEEAMELALIENLQREDLNPAEEAEGYRALMEQYGLTQEQVAERVGKSRSAVANTVRLLGLPPELLEKVRDGRITAGHGRALLAIGDEEQRSRAAELAERGASVRELERVAKERPQRGSSAARPAAAKQESFYSEVELALTAELGRKVRVAAGQGKGTLTVEFYSKEDLADLAYRLAGEKRR